MRLAHACSGLIGAVLILASCASDSVMAQPPRGNDPIGDLIGEKGAAPAEPLVDTLVRLNPQGRGDDFDQYLVGLLKASCPAGVKRTEPVAIELKVAKVPLQAINPLRKTVGELTFVGGFHLTSGDKRLGGLSGIEVLDNGNLLAVSDQGDFVWIDLADDAATPKAARIATMLNAQGAGVRGKAEGDAEGVAINAGIALVSFERNHRVLAFDLSKCGASARGAPIVRGGRGGSFAQAFSKAKIAVGDNQGPEPLAVTPDWYVFAGIETKAGEASALSARPIEQAPDFGLRIAESAPDFVGLDLLGAPGGDTLRAFSLHRSSQPLSGTAISVIETVFERYLDQTNLPARVVSAIDERSHYRFKPKSSRKLADMNVLLTIDNFEGVAARRMPDGRVRLYIVSDNNFSASQRTLLMVFDLKS